MATLAPYPTELEAPASVLYGHLSGDGSSRAHGVHAAYEIVGAGLGRFYPDPEGGASAPRSVSGLKKVPLDVSHEDGMAALKNLAGDGSTGTTMKGALTDQLLQLAFAFAMKKLQEWLGKIDTP